MTTLPPIQPRPILCKTTTNNLQSSSNSVGLIHPSIQPSTLTNVHYVGTNNDLSSNGGSSQVSVLSAPLSSYEEFLKRLREFHRCRQTTFRSLPTIGGQVVDLQALYTSVVAHGGWDKVNDRQLWSSVAGNFGIDSSCLNGTQALKNIYIRYLYAFEKISDGENIDSHEDDDEDSKRRNVGHLQRVPQSYNHAQHTISDSLRAQHGLFRDFVRRGEYDKLELALLCGFPNELTFAINTLLLLSSTTNNSVSFQLYKCPRLLDILFRHIGLFLSSDMPIHDHCLKLLYDNMWSKHLNYHTEQFWIEVCSPKIVQQLLNVDIDENHKHLYNNFNLNSNENQQQQELRIEQILMIIRNLSFDRANAMYIVEALRSSSSMTYTFLLLISHCDRKVELQKYAYDIWTNLALHMHLRLISNDEGRLIRQLIHEMLNGKEEDGQQDRLKIIRALEIIANLAHAGNDNGVYLMDYVDNIIQRLVHVSDILILVHTLECLYQLSELGEQLCNTILKMESSVSVIGTLIDLLTIEARSFSSQTIKTIKIVEMSTGPVLLPSYHQPPLTQQGSNISQSVVVISAAQQQSQHSTYATENTEMNKSYYANNNKLIIQQYSKVVPASNVLSSGNLLAVAPSSMPNPPTTSILVTNSNSQANQSIDKKRKHDSISETIAAVVNGASSSSPLPVTPPPPKRSRSSRPRSTPTKNSVVAAPAPPPSRLIPSSSVDDDTSSMESSSTSNSIHSAMADLLDRCSSPPSVSTIFDNDVRACLNELCNRVASTTDESLSSASIIYNPIPSPIFKRKIEEQSSSNKRRAKTTNQSDDPPPKKKRNRPAAKKAANETLHAATTITKKEEPSEQETCDIKPTLTTSSIITPPASINSTDYMCEWDNCCRSFTTARAVFHHACSAHVKHLHDYVCFWNGCDRIKRQKWALISHIQERHCSEAAFRQAKLKSVSSVHPTMTNVTVPTSSVPSSNGPTASLSFGYAPDAAWLAVRRHMQVNSFDDLLIKGKEGPLTKSIRLTSALILRNIARHSSIGKQSLRQYEQHLATLALESSEASNTLGSCLFELYN